MTARRRLRGDDGDIGGTIELAAAVALILVPLIAAAGVGTVWMKQKMAAEDIAADLARAAITAPLDLTVPGQYDMPLDGRDARLDALVVQLADDYGVAAADISYTVSLDFDPAPTYPSEYRRGEELTVTVQIQAPVASIPFLGSRSGPTIEGRHTELIDEHRSITRP